MPAFSPAPARRRLPALCRFGRHRCSRRADPKADAIVVLTGGYQRIDQAVELLQQRRRQAAADLGRPPGDHRQPDPPRHTQSPADLFACCVDIGYDAHRHDRQCQRDGELDPRQGLSRACSSSPTTTTCRAACRTAPRRSGHRVHSLSGRQFRPEDHGNWFTNPNALRTMLSEYAKVLLTGRRASCSAAHRPAAFARRKPDDAQQQSYADRRLPAFSCDRYRVGSGLRRRHRRFGTACMIILRSILFNTVFYLNLIVQMIVLTPIYFLLPRKAGLSRFRRTGRAVQHWLMREDRRHHLRDRGPGEHPEGRLHLRAEAPVLLGHLSRCCPSSTTRSTSSSAS